MTTRQMMIVKRKCRAAWHRFQPKVRLYVPRLLLVGLLLWAFVLPPVHFHVSFGSPAFGSQTNSFGTEGNVRKASLNLWESEGEIGPDGLNLANPATAVSDALSPEQQALASKFSNLGFFLSPETVQKNKISPELVAHKKQKCLNYIQKYLKTAREEAELYNIPVSITLAQAMLESNVGDSQLALKENNHFGIKCGGCSTCRCANYTDDSPKDMFRVFDSPWFSFREHSKLLQNKRYKHLLQLPRSDYRNWAYGLKAAGYATDKKYAEKLIAIIEVFKLNRYDTTDL